jgi:hypothetical protein
LNQQIGAPLFEPFLNGKLFRPVALKPGFECLDVQPRLQQALHGAFIVPHDIRHAV